jgi:hypothetical protein
VDLGAGAELELELGGVEWTAKAWVATCERLNGSGREAAGLRIGLQGPPCFTSQSRASISLRRHAALCGKEDNIQYTVWNIWKE